MVADLALPGRNGTLTHSQARQVTTELTNLVGNLCSGSAPCTTAKRVTAVTVGVCAAALGNANVLID